MNSRYTRMLGNVSGVYTTVSLPVSLPVSTPFPCCPRLKEGNGPAASVRRSQYSRSTEVGSACQSQDPSYLGIALLEAIRRSRIVAPSRAREERAPAGDRHTEPDLAWKTASEYGRPKKV